MNGGRSDASTSTDDIKGRPLCLFYFTHPFGVLSPEPPAVLGGPAHYPAAAHVARTYVNMQPVPAPSPAWGARSPRDASAPCARPDYELGLATVHRNPINLLGAPGRHYTLNFSTSDTLSSSLFASDLWLSSSSSRSECARKVVPYNRILPPLALPTPRDLAFDSSDDFWPNKCSVPEKFALPPIDRSSVTKIEESAPAPAAARAESGAESSARARECSRSRTRTSAPAPARRGVSKPGKRSRPSAARATLARLLRRNVKGGRGTDCARSLRAALDTVRAAWREPISLLRISRASSSSVPSWCPSESEGGRRDTADPARTAGGMLRGELSPPAAAASPGLLRRRYSVPETVMRKYRLAQQRSDTEDGPATSPSLAPTSPQRVPRDRELMRRCALLRRLYGRSVIASPPRCCCESRSLDSSRSELRPSSSRLVSRLVVNSPYRNTINDPVLDFSTSAYLTQDVASSYIDSTPENPSESFESQESVRPVPRLSQKEDTVCMSPAASITVSDSPPAPCELLEIVVSECVRTADRSSSSSPSRARIPNNRRNINVDEYVSNILVESLSSLSDRLESINDSIGDGHINIVEKEIKVRLQNAGVNTVYASPPTADRTCGTEEVQEEVRPLHVHKAALHQIQQLFLDEPAAPASLPHVETYARGNVDDDSCSAALREYSRPLSGSMEVNSSGGAGGAECSRSGSPCTSLADSLDDPASPRALLRRPPAARRLTRPPLARSTVAVLNLLPESEPNDDAPSELATIPHREKSESFFIRLEDEGCDCEKENIVVADHMPEKIKQRLHRRHRRREQRMECARRGRGRGRGSRSERDAVVRAHRATERECHAIVDALVDDVIAKIAQDEYKCMRIKRRPMMPSNSDENVSKARNWNENFDSNGSDSSTGNVRGGDRRGPRRLYHKSEIHEGDKCIEILEIVEYVNTSRSSGTTSDESNSTRRRSRIPVPIHNSLKDAAQRYSRVSGGGRASPLPPPVRRASVPCESRARSASLRFERVFDAIPEERSGFGGESPAPAQSPRRGKEMRGAATSPPAPDESRVRSASTMTSPTRRPPAGAARWLAPQGSKRDRCVETDQRGEVCAGGGTARQCSPGGEAPARHDDTRPQRKAVKAKVSRGAGRRSAPGLVRKTDKRRIRMISMEKSEEETIEPARPVSCSSSDCGSAGCSPPRARAPPAAQPPRAAHAATTDNVAGAEGWSVTVAGSGRAALPADLEMRLRFPGSASRATCPARRHPAAAACSDKSQDEEQECWCRRCCSCAPPCRRSPRALSPPPPHPVRHLTLHNKKEGLECSHVAAKNAKKSIELLPELAATRARAARSPRTARAARTARDLKARCVRSPRCWAAPAHASSRVAGRARAQRTPTPTSMRTSEELSVLGCAIVPEQKPRVPSMSERDLTRHLLRAPWPFVALSSHPNIIAKQKCTSQYNLQH